MFSIKSISSLNLRCARGVNRRKIDDAIPYTCSVCMKKLKLGKNSGMMVKIIYVLNGEEREVRMCDTCSDVFCDIARYGPRVLGELSYWRRQSVVSRMSLVQENLLCFNCLDKLDSHVFIKYDDLRIASRAEVFDSKRLCAKCAISYMSLMLASKSISKAKLLLAPQPKFGENKYEFQYT